MKAEQIYDEDFGRRTGSLSDRLLMVERDYERHYRMLRDDFSRWVLDNYFRLVVKIKP